MRVMDDEDDCWWGWWTLCMCDIQTDRHTSNFISIDKNEWHTLHKCTKPVFTKRHSGTVDSSFYLSWASTLEKDSSTLSTYRSDDSTHVDSDIDWRHYWFVLSREPLPPPLLVDFSLHKYLFGADVSFRYGPARCSSHPPLKSAKIWLWLTFEIWWLP